MPSAAKQRRTWFALCKSAGIAEEDRHDVQEAWTGKRSLKDWAPADYDKAIGGLQRALGQHRDAHAHVCEDHANGVAPGVPPGVWATAAQARYIEDLCDRITWRTGRQHAPRRYASSTILRGPEKALRRRRLKAAYDGYADRASREAAWQKLTRDEARFFIRALDKAARIYPRQLPRSPAAPGVSPPPVAPATPPSSVAPGVSPPLVAPGVSPGEEKAHVH